MGKPLNASNRTDMKRRSWIVAVCAAVVVVGIVCAVLIKRCVQRGVEEIPMERILLETDCPYLAPTPHRGKRNSSLYIPLIAEKIAQIKGIPYYKVLEKTHENAKNLFLKGK